MNFIKNIKRSYLKDYLIYSVRRIEKTASRYKRWDTTPEILGLLTKLLTIYAPILVDDQLVLRLKQIPIQTQFESFHDFEVYCHELMKQTIPFILGEESRKPRIESVLKEHIYIREMSIAHFLEIDNSLQLNRVLASLVVLSAQLDDHLKDVPQARRKILLNMLREVILPVYTSIEQIYEVIVDEEAN